MNIFIMHFWLVPGTYALESAESRKEDLPLCPDP